MSFDEIYTAHTTTYERTLPSGNHDNEQERASELDSLNLIFVVGFALLIAFLAQWINRKGGRGGRKK